MPHPRRFTFWPLNRRFLFFPIALLILELAACSEVAVSRMETDASSRRSLPITTQEDQLLALASPPAKSSKGPLKYFSPAGDLGLRFEILTNRDSTGEEWRPHFTILNSKTGASILSGKLGFQFAEIESSLLSSPDLVIENSVDQLVRDQFPLAVGRVSRVDESYREIRLALSSKMNPVYKWILIFRVYDQAVAVRSEVLDSSGGVTQLSLLHEGFDLKASPDTKLIGLALPFGSAYEAHYETHLWAKIPRNQTWGLPLLLQSRHNTVMVTEADLHDYANAYLMARPDEGEEFEKSPNVSQDHHAPIAKDAMTLSLTMPPLSSKKHAITSAARNESPPVLVSQIVSIQRPFTTPWRVMWIGAGGTEGLRVPLESNVLASLNHPPEPIDWSWIHPGKVLFQWWNGYTTPGRSFSPAADALEASTLKRHIDFCAENGIPYFSLDGYEFDRAWYGGFCSSFDPKTQDILRPLAAIRMPELLAYAKSRGVKARVWFHGDGLTTENMDRVLATYASWGIDGIMVDFMGDDTQAGINKNEAILQIAARHHLVVSFHGIAKPTGLTRTYPNLLSEEGVMGQEYNKWDGPHSTPNHEVEVGIIRGAVGPMDTHQGSFRPVPESEFRAHTLQPNSMGTLAHELSTYIVYENEQSMLADFPEAYLKHPEELKLVSEIPVTWDETRVIRADLLEHVLIIARRSGDNWYIGAMAGDVGRKVRIPLEFLPAGEFRATVFQDQPGSLKNGELIFKRRLKVNRHDEIDLALANGGGAVLKLDRSKSASSS